MYMYVKLLNGCPEKLTYKIPDNWITDGLIGTIVEVPLLKRKEAALVEHIVASIGPVPYTIREAHSREIVPNDPFYRQFIKKLSQYYALDEIHFLKRIRASLHEKESDRTVIPEKQMTIPKSAILTDEQQAVVNAITPAITAGMYYPALLQGVTGSGKTEVYKKLIEQAYAHGKSTLFLLPEVSLAVQFTALFRKSLSSAIPIFSFHSATSMKEKKALWQHLLNNKPALIVGVHLPVVLPIPHLGLIIIDEEHDVGFQEKKHPRLNTKEAALLRAQICSIPIVAGSATPSITSLYNIEQRGWHFFELKKRYAGAFPAVKVVKLTSSKSRKLFWLSKELEEAIAQQLEKKEQTIIFLNRRGHSFFIQCKKCGFIPHCNQCSVSLTYHRSEVGGKGVDVTSIDVSANEQLRCHYCTYVTTMPNKCTSCPSTEFLKKGIGTQQVVSMLEKVFPQARIARADLDTTINKKNWTQILSDFENGASDILVGTQTITKGYHFPRVTLVGILWADINLGLPVYNAAEVTLQQLIQVAGRAGRQSPDSQVIVQTMIDHPIFKYLNEQHYSDYYTSEIANRKLVHYPPMIRFAEIELKSENEQSIDTEAKALSKILQEYIDRTNKKVQVLGPSQPPVHMIKKVFSRKLYLKAQTISDILECYKRIDHKAFASSIFFTPNPLST